MNRQLSLGVQITLFIALLALGIASRFLPHPPDATALTAVLFASALYLGPRITIALGLLMLLWSDVFFGTYELPVMVSVYGSFLLIGGVGVAFARARSLGVRMLMLASASFLFFLITNAAVWYFTPWYPKDVSGLILSLTLGLPFLKNMIIADFLYTPALLGALALAFKFRAVKTPAYAA